MNDRPKPKAPGYLVRRGGKGRGPLKSGLTLKGEFRLEVIGKDGKVRDRRVVKNLVVNGGLDFVKELLLDSVTPTTLATLTHIAVGTDGTTETPADTALGAEHARQAFDSYASGGVGIADVEVTFPAATFPTTTTIAESGVFDAGAGGNMLNRIAFAGVPLTVTDALRVTWRLTLANA